MVNPCSSAEQQRSVYVVYPAALNDGWEVVKEHSECPVCFDTRLEATSYAKARAMMDGGAVVKLENWFGHTEELWEVQPEAGRHLAPIAS